MCHDRARLVGGLLAASLLMAGRAAAQTALPPAPAAADASADQGSEIVVTANKRQQRVQDVGASVSALGQTALAVLGRQDVTALALQLPSVQVQQYSPTLTIFNIRGVSQNDFADSQEAPIAFYSDEVYVAALGAISGQTFDLDRVEVLRGPQGTLFGRNATGGLVQIVSAAPTRDFHFFTTLTAGSYGEFASEGAVSGSLTPWLRARLSFTTDNHGGYIRNTLGPSLGDANFWGLRGQLAADLSPRDTLRLKVERLRNDHERSGGLYSWVAAKPNADGLGVPLAPGENYYGTGPGADPFGYVNTSGTPFVQSEDRTGFFDRTFSSLTGRYEHKLAHATVTAIGDYQYLNKRYGEDTDMSPNAIFNYDTRQRVYQYSGELRINGTAGPLTYVAGGYLIGIHSRNGYQITSPAGILPQQNYGGLLTTDGWAVFGQGEYKLVPHLTAVLGARFSDDVKKLYFTHFTSGAEDFAFSPSTDPGLARRPFRDWSGKAQLNWTPKRDLLVYAGVNRGTKAGGFSTIAFTPIDPNTLPFKSEVLVNYEGGVKATLLDRKLEANASGFHYDYGNYQAFTFQGLSQFVSNLPAKLNGFEFDVTAHPVPALTLNAFGTYLSTKIEGVTLPSLRVVDRVLPQAPQWSIGWMARYEFVIGKGRAALQTDWKYDASQYFSTFNAPIDHEPARTVGNARLSYTVDRTEFAVFANNITNRWYRIYDLDLGSALGVANQSFAKPRWIGGSIGYRY